METKKPYDPIQILSILPEPVICLNEKLVMTYVNSRVQEAFGYSREELYGQPVTRLIPMELRDDITEALNRLHETTHSPTDLPEPAKLDYTVRRKGGPTFPAEITASFVKKGHSTLIILIIHDLTPRLRRQEAHQEIDASFKAVVLASPLAIYSLDRLGHVWLWNPAAERIFGWTRDEVIGRPTPTVPAEEQAKYKALLNKALQGERITGEEVKRQRKDGTLIDVNVFTAPLHDSSGEVVGLMAVLEDITQRKEAERQLRALNKQLAELNQYLELRVQERAAEAEQRAKELARSNEELQQFAYVASHDLQEPLRMVASYTRLLARRYRGKLDEDADEFIDYAVNGATRMQQLINDLLSYSRLGTRAKPFVPVDCRTVIDRALENLTPAVAEAEAIIDIGPVPTVPGDASQLTQLFQNMIGNALKFRSKDRPRISVSAEERDDEWLFTIRDNGIGIDPVYGKQIFEIFQRLHTRAEYPGTGIGLAICKKIIERHGGRIWLEPSKPGSGSVFCFTITTHEETHDLDPANAGDPSN